VYPLAVASQRYGSAVSSPASRARCVAGALVALSSASLTAVAHTAAGGSVPVGAPLASLLIVSVAVGAIAAAITVTQQYYARIAALMAALCGGQLLGHLTLSVAAGHHGVGMVPSTSMLAMHVIAAAILGLLIGLVEHVYVVCESVLCWLRLFAVNRCRPATRLPRTGTTSVVVQSVLLRSGLGMRAPPQGTALGV